MPWYAYAAITLSLVELVGAVVIVVLLGGQALVARHRRIKRGFLK